MGTLSEKGCGAEKGAVNVYHLAEVRDSTKILGYGTKHLLRFWQRNEMPYMLQGQNEQAPTFDKFTFALISLLTCFLMPSVKFSKVGSAT